VGRFDGAVFNSIVSHHFHKLGISRVASHGLGLVGRNGVFDFTLGEAFIMLAEGLNHGHGIHGLLVDVGESAAHALSFSVEGDLFVLGGGDDPIATVELPDFKSISLQLGEREEICDAIVD
jgi:hypothetical protein